MLLPFATVALAGKLSTDNGFQGVPFGDASKLDDALRSRTECKQNPTATMPFASHKWECTTRIDDTPVVSAFWSEGRYFYQVGVAYVGSDAAACAVIREVLTTAWGPPLQIGPLPGQLRWRDGSIESNYYVSDPLDDRPGLGRCYFYVVRPDIRTQAREAGDATRREAIRRGTEDL